MNELKSDWRMVKFGDVVRQCKESVDRDNNPFERYVEGGNMDSENIHIRRWGTFGADYVGPAFHRIFRKGQVLYGSRRTYLKKVAIADFDGITANTTFVCETKDQKIFMQELLPFLMLTDSFTEHSIRESKGSTNPYINWPDIAKYEFPLPPLDEQKRIAEILWAADEATEKWMEAYQQTESALNSTRSRIFQELFQTEESVSIKDVGRWISGGTPSRSRSDFWNGDFPWISPKDMKQDVIFDSEEKLTVTALNEKVTILPPESILIVVRGMILAHTFPVALTSREVTFNQDMKGIIPNSYFSAEFVFHWFKDNSSKILQATEESTHGTKRLATDVLYGMQIPKPSPAKQEMAVTVFETFRTKLAEISEHIDSFQQMLRSLRNAKVGTSHV